MKLHKRIHKRLIRHYHRRKHIEHDKLPNWKKKVLLFNHRYFNWLEILVEYAIPWLVLMLLFIILSEFGHSINVFIEKIFHHSFHFLDVIAEFAHQYSNEIVLLDKIIIGFFIFDLYFHFFKKATISGFIRTYFLDILAVLPLGLVVGALTREIGTAQTATHIVVDAERLATRATEAERIAVRAVEAERFAVRAVEAEKIVVKSAELEKLAKVGRGSRFLKFFSRIPRLLRLYRIYYFFIPPKSRKSLNRKSVRLKKRKQKRKTKK